MKLAQLAIMLAEIDSVVKSCKAKGEHCNLILCGDFNSVPHMPLYQLITTGELYFQGLPAWMVRLKHCKDQQSIINAWQLSSFSHCGLVWKSYICNHLCIYHVQQISGQEDLSHKAHCHRLFAPLWPSCLGITDNCQYTTVKEIFKSQSQKPGQCLKS